MKLTDCEVCGVKEFVTVPGMEMGQNGGLPVGLTVWVQGPFFVRLVMIHIQTEFCQCMCM